VSAFVRIQHEVKSFTDRTGLQPNLLLVDTNFELSLNVHGIKTATELWGMKVIVCDTIRCGILVARTEQDPFLR
jgi:hypothetical protein